MDWKMAQKEGGSSFQAKEQPPCWEGNNQSQMEKRDHVPFAFPFKSNLMT